MLSHERRGVALIPAGLCRNCGRIFDCSRNAAAGLRDPITETENPLQCPQSRLLLVSTLVALICHSRVTTYLLALIALICINQILVTTLDQQTQYMWLTYKYLGLVFLTMFPTPQLFAIYSFQTFNAIRLSNPRPGATFERLAKPNYLGKAIFTHDAAL